MPIQFLKGLIAKAAGSTKAVDASSVDGDTVLAAASGTGAAIHAQATGSANRAGDFEGPVRISGANNGKTEMLNISTTNLGARGITVTQPSGNSGVGVYASSDGGIAVSGTSSTNHGVKGIATGNGYGVYGSAAGNGYGIYAENTAGNYAAYLTGKTKVDGLLEANGGLTVASGQNLTSNGGFFAAIATLTGLLTASGGASISSPLTIPTNAGVPIGGSSGGLAIDTTNHAIAFKDGSSWREGQIIESGSAFPASPYTGQRFYRTDFKADFVYSGSVWEQVSTGTFASSFPASPVTNLKVYRADRKREYFYDGTRWLTTQRFDPALPSRSSQPYSGTTFFDMSIPGYQNGVYIEEIQAILYTAQAFTASDYYSVELWAEIAPANGVTTQTRLLTTGSLTGFNTSGFTTLGGFYEVHSDYNQALPSTSYNGIFIRVLQVGTTAKQFQFWGSVGYRLIG